MKKTMRTFTAIMMSAALAVSASSMFAFTAAADDTTYQLAVANNENDKATHQYVAYQIFSGTLAEIGGVNQLTNIQWADGVNSVALLAALKTNAAFGSGDANLFKDCTTAADVARVLETFESNRAQANAFADAVAANLGSTSYNIPTQKVPGPGYYFIKDTITTKPADGSKQYAYSDHILKVLEDADLDFSAKAVVPTIEKKIGTDFTTGTKTNTASIGDKVPFVLESSVPDMSKYNNYYFIINDTFCDGLTFNDDVAITIGTYTLTKDTDFTVTQNGQNVKIVFKDFYKQLQLGNTLDDTSDDGGHIGEKITVKYSATLNENAIITSAGNPNTANLTFSNNPNHTYGSGDEPTNDEKNNGEVIGQTPDSKTKTFTTAIKLTKIDASTKAKLAGAKFQIQGNGVKAVLINDEIYKEDAAGTYYMLKNGTFTTAESTESTADQYDSTTTKYKKINNVISSTASETVNKTGYSGSDGVIIFKGLGEGTYNITELEAPDGYNKLGAPITINIEATTNDNDLSCAWTVKKGGTGITPTDNVYAFDVENSKGIKLPGTGGIGTTPFYVIGALFICGGITLLIVKKRMKINETNNQ